MDRSCRCGEPVMPELAVCYDCAKLCRLCYQEPSNAGICAACRRRYLVNRRTSGQSYDVYIGRGSKWGNPFSFLPGARARYIVPSREAAVEAYERYLMRRPQLLAALPELVGKSLGCYCVPAPCHGDVLLRLANA